MFHFLCYVVFCSPQPSPVSVPRPLYRPVPINTQQTLLKNIAFCEHRPGNNSFFSTHQILHHVTYNLLFFQLPFSVPIYTHQTLFKNIAFSEHHRTYNFLSSFNEINFHQKFRTPTHITDCKNIVYPLLKAIRGELVLLLSLRSKIY